MATKPKTPHNESIKTINLPNNVI